MVNKSMSKALDTLIDEILNSEEVIEFKKLEKLVLENKEISLMLDRLHEVEKQAVNARELGLENTYLAYKKEYDDILKQFQDDVLISSYINAKIDIKNPIPVTILSGVIEKLVIPSIAYLNNPQKLHFVEPRGLSTFS